MSGAILVTGSSGFVGSALLRRLAQETQYPLHALVRRMPDSPESRVRYSVLDDFRWLDSARGGFSEVDTVIHLASRVHVMDETAEDPLAAFREVNVAGTLSLARAAADAGVRRFIFVSSIKVNGESTDGRSPFAPDEAPAPQDPYGVSKLEAEDALRQLAVQTSLEVVIVRPPLVYGPGVKANFLSMMKWLDRGVPLPFGAVHNRRSLVSLGNLVDLLMTCIDHPAAGNQTFLVSDGEDLSTTDLLVRLGAALGKPARLVPVPVALIGILARLVGKGGLSRRLCGSLQIDIGKTRSLLGWAPPQGVRQALQITADNFLNERNT